MNEATAISTRNWTEKARRIRVPLGFAFAAFYMWRAQPNWISVVIGMIIASIGIVIRALAAGHVKKNREVTTSGPYAYVRNPLYLGSMVIAVGFAVAARDVGVAIVSVVFFLAIYLPVIRGEQNYLREHFAEYDGYTRRVPSLLPRTIWFKGAARGFSRELYFRHREYNAVLGAAAMLLVLVAKILWFPISR
jgi:protein-S-isoprenylcysteine O-methyltransferase Ste14